MSRLEASIAQADLSNLPLDKQVDLLLKIEKTLQEEKLSETSEPVNEDLSSQTVRATEAVNIMNRLRSGEISAQEKSLLEYAGRAAAAGKSAEDLEKMFPSL